MGRQIAFKSRVVYIVRSMVDIYVRWHVTRSAAALSYYLTMSVFPFLICVSAILGSLQLEESYLFEMLETVVPAAALAVISDFLSYVSGNRTTFMLLIGLSAMLTSSSAAFRSITAIMGVIQGDRRFSGLWGAFFSFVFSIAFLAAIYVSGLVILSGEWLMLLLERQFGFGDILSIWVSVRFVLLFLMLFAIIFGIYIISAPKETKKTHRLPGALAASVVLVVVSMLYSRMISASIRYEVVYGSLASFIIMMVWLYTCGLILIMGNVFNIALRDSHGRLNKGGNI